jgi:CBS domain-containing protein
MKKCQDVMTKNPVCCVPGDMVVEVAKMMKTGNVGSIPVVENQHTKRLIGIVTDRDLALKILAEENDAKSTRVTSVMTHKVVTCRADDDLQKAMDAMAKNQLRRLPVVDQDDMVVGIIAQADVAMHMEQPEKTAEMVKGISQSNRK